MSDYLDNLLAKSTGIGETVRPRPVSAYEPLPGARLPSLRAGEDPLLPGDEPPPATERTRPLDLPEGRDSLSPVEPLAAPRPQRPEPRSALPEPGPATPASIAPATKALPPQPARDAAPSPQPLGTAQTGPEPAPLVQVQAESTVSRPAMAGPAQPAPGAPSLQAAARQAGEGTFRPPTPAAGDRFAPTITPVARPSRPVVRPEAAGPTPRRDGPVEGPPPRPAGPVPVVARPHREAPSEPQRPTAAPAAQAQSEPTIQVTIGRIEVRAAPPAPAQTKAKAPAAPLMTLEDYLRRRHGGER